MAVARLAKFQGSGRVRGQRHMHMKPCFGYIRVSTARQGDGASLEAQKDAITGFASQNNLTITEWFEEQETASKTGRPIFDSMLRDLGRGAAAGVVMHKIDRSSRNYSDWARLHDLALDERRATGRHGDRHSGHVHPDDIGVSLDDHGRVA